MAEPSIAPDPGTPPAWMKPLRAPLEILGDLSIFFAQSAAAIFRPPYRVGLLFSQLEFMAYGSLFVVGLTGLFTGMVLALQTVYAFSLFNAQSLVGATVELSLARELAPVFTCIVLVARVGSAVATELGTMRVTEQIDALKALATEPVQYLFVPRVISGIVMLPFLVILGDALGIGGGYLVAVKLLGVNAVVYKQNTFQFINMQDLWSGVIKAGTFGLILTLTGCVRGYYTVGGAEGVGRSTTRAVVSASLIILLTDFFLTKLLL